MVWWIPQAFWEASLADNPSVFDFNPYTGGKLSSR